VLSEGILMPLLFTNYGCIVFRMLNQVIEPGSHPTSMTKEACTGSFVKNLQML
jgi:hypothetical protein